MSDTSLSKSNEAYFKEHLKEETYVSFKMKNGSFIKGQVQNVDFENKKIVVNNSIDNDKNASKIIPISDQLRVMRPGQRHDIREVTNIKQLNDNYGITYNDFKDNIYDMCSKNSCMSKVINAQVLTPNENGINELKNYPVRLKIIKDENGSKRLKQVVGYTLESFKNSYTGEQIGLQFTQEMKDQIIKNGHLGVKEIATKFDAELKPKFIGFDNELNRVIPISIEKIKSDLKNNFTDQEINTLLQGGTAYSKTGKEVKIDTVSYITKGNIVKSTGKTVREIQTQSEEVKAKKNVKIDNNQTDPEKKKRSKGVRV